MKKNLLLLGIIASLLSGCAIGFGEYDPAPVYTYPAPSVIIYPPHYYPSLYPYHYRHYYYHGGRR